MSAVKTHGRRLDPNIGCFECSKLGYMCYKCSKEDDFLHSDMHWFGVSDEDKEDEE